MAAAAGREGIRLRARHHRVLKKHRIPPSYGFIIARQLERDPDGAAALQIWVDGGNPLGNHTYTHLDLTKNSVEDFQREILRNEPVLELLMAPGKPWAARTIGAGSAIRTCTKATRWKNAARCAPSCRPAAIASRRPRSTSRTILEQRVRALLDAKDDASIEWLRESYLANAARDFTRFQIQNSRGRYSAATSTM